MKQRFALLGLLAVFIAAPGHANVARAPRAGEETILPVWWNAAITTVTRGGTVLPPDRGATITAVTFHVAGAAATATGSMTLRVSDGTNNCDAVVDCTSSLVRTAGSKRQATSGACSFAPNAALVLSATQCTTAQPTATSMIVVGKWN